MLKTKATCTCILIFCTVYSLKLRLVVIFSLSTDINELSLAGRDTTDDNAATITGQSSRAPRKQLRPVMRSTRQKRPPRSTYSTSLISIDDREDNGQEEPIVRRPNVK